MRPRRKWGEAEPAIAASPVGSARQALSHDGSSNGRSTVSHGHKAPMVAQTPRSGLLQQQAEKEKGPQTWTIPAKETSRRTAPGKEERKLEPAAAAHASKARASALQPAQRVKAEQAAKDSAGPQKPRPSPAPMPPVISPVKNRHSTTSKAHMTAVLDLLQCHPDNHKHDSSERPGSTAGCNSSTPLPPAVAALAKQMDEERQAAASAAAAALQRVVVADEALELMQDFALVVRAAEKQHATLALDMFVRLHDKLQQMLERQSQQCLEAHVDNASSTAVPASSSSQQPMPAVPAPGGKWKDAYTNALFDDSSSTSQDAVNGGGRDAGSSGKDAAPRRGMQAAKGPLMMALLHKQQHTPRQQQGPQQQQQQQQHHRKQPLRQEHGEQLLQEVESAVLTWFVEYTVPTLCHGPKLHSRQDCAALLRLLAQVQDWTRAQLAGLEGCHRDVGGGGKESQLRLLQKEVQDALVQWGYQMHRLPESSSTGAGAAGSISSNRRAAAVAGGAVAGK